MPRSTMQGFPFFPCYKDGYSTKKWSDPPETLEEIKAFAEFYHEYVHTMECPSATADVIEDMHGLAMDAEHITFSPDEGTTTWRRLRETAWCVRCGTDLGPRSAMSLHTWASFLCPMH